jgi:hypothetical protein
MRHTLTYNVRTRQRRRKYSNVYAWNCRYQVVLVYNTSIFLDAAWRRQNFFCWRSTFVSSVWWVPTLRYGGRTVLTLFEPWARKQLVRRPFPKIHIHAILQTLLPCTARENPWAFRERYCDTRGRKFRYQINVHNNFIASRYWGGRGEYPENLRRRKGGGGGGVFTD